jgi:hypothetical protein
MTSAASFSRAIPEDPAALLARHVQKIQSLQARNALLDRYYEGQNRVRDLGIAIPPGLSRIETVVGWPTMTVDVLEERLDIEGFALPGVDIADLGIPEIWAANGLAVESGPAHTDALIYGLEFVAVSVGGDNEPDPLVTIEPPTRMTGEWDARLRRLSSAGAVRMSEDGQRINGASLYLPEVTYLLENGVSGWELLDRQEHNLGRVPVARLVNRPRSGRPWGTSQISKAIISYTDTAVRTLLGMEVAREFYSSPQRYMLGADETAFMGADGQPRTQWEVILGRVLAISRDEQGELPQVGQFNAASPAPYLDQVKGLASLVAAEAAIPVSYLGFNTDNPPSADGIRSLEARLVKGAERRQRVFGAGWCEAMRLALLVRDGELPDGIDSLAVNWRDAATPTKAAAADRVMKLVSAGVLPPTSEVTYEELGVSETDKARLLADARMDRSTRRLDALVRAVGSDGVEAPAG